MNNPRNDDEREEIEESLADLEFANMRDEDDGPPAPGAEEKVRAYREEYLRRNRRKKPATS